MKKTIRTIAFLAFLAMATTSCQKDNCEFLYDAGVTQTMIQYTVAGTTNTVTISGNEDWSLFMDNILALAREGYTVVINGDSRTNVKQMEAIVFTTTDPNEVKVWTNQMVNQGYTVTVDYNPSTGVYTCTAFK